MENVIIIGGGPAGLTAAIYTARALLKPLVFEGYQAGGQLMLTHEVENFPGFPKGVMGPELMGLFREQAQRFGARLISSDVSKVHFQSRPFEVYDGKEKHETHSVIIATGASARWIGLDSEKKFRGRGVSSCATCDGAFFQNQEVLVVGGGDSALEEALFLTRFASKITIVHRRDQLRASPILQERALQNSKIAWKWNCVVEEILGDQNVTGARLRNLKTQKNEEMKVQGIFVAIGHQPNTSLFQGQLEMDSQGYLIPREKTQTEIPGIFVCGDVRDLVYRQAITAAGSGCMAAIDCSRYLEKQFT